jgi:predicted ATPase
MPTAIRYLKISNYRSIDELELHDIPAFAVFAGANGSGKSNFFNALDFASLIARFGDKEALIQHGGEEDVRCVGANLPTLKSQKFRFQITTAYDYFGNPIDIELDEGGVAKGLGQFVSQTFKLKKEVTDEDFPKVYEKISKDLDRLQNWLRKKKNGTLSNLDRELLDNTIEIYRIAWRRTPKQVANSHFFMGIGLYRIEPREIKESNMSIHDDSVLQRYGQNLAAVLRRLEKNDEMRETIIDWLQLIVPQLEIVRTETERLSGSAQLAFKETGTDKLFPAHLISDGTIYLLCLLVAMLDRPKIGITLIEEPERGLHPKAIMELVKGFREHATIESPIWLTTHSESVVRMLKDNELWLVDKKDGKTQINPVRNIENLQLNLDEAWLSNALNGGLPW